MKNKLPKYDNYKPSNVEWLGDIPQHWEVKPGFTILSESKERNNGLKEKTVLSLSYGKVIIKPEEKLTGLVPESFETYQLVSVGDIIIRPTDLQNDKTSLRTGLAKNKGIITSAYVNLRVKIDYSNSFYHYYLHTIDLNKVIYGLGSGLRQNISFLDFKRFPFPIPPLSEQEKIAQFLDEKTTKIDKAIEIKQRQIELLKERRQILIHRAVTRGLHENVPLKDSGVEWIGEIPEHWVFTKLGHYINILSGYAFPSVGFSSDTGIKLLRGINVSIGNLRWEDVVFWPEDKVQDLQSYFLEENDIVFGMDRPMIAGGMRVATVTKEDLPCLLLQRVTRIRPKLGLLKEYLSVILMSKSFTDYFHPILSGVSVPHISPSQIQSFKIGIPDLETQKAIVSHIENISVKISKAIGLKEREIEVLKEYKSSLINSAVTGKVKIV